MFNSKAKKATARVMGIQKVLKNILKSPFFILFVVTVISWLFSDLTNQYFPLETIETLTPLIWAKITALLLFVCLILTIVVIIKSWPEPSPKHMFLKDLGITKELVSGDFICTSCHSNGIRSPLKERQKGWFCQNQGCRKVYYKPGHEPSRDKENSNGGIWKGDFS